MVKPREIPAPVFESSSSSESPDYSDSEPEPAKKAPTRTPAAVLPQKPSAKAPPKDSSSDDDSSSDESSDSEPEPQPAALHQKPSAKASAQAADSTSDESSDSDSDSDPALLSDDSSSSDSELDSDTDLKKPSSLSVAKRPALTKTPAPAPPAGMKRPATSALAPDADGKRSKNVGNSKEGGEFLKRIFAREDEIVVLEELVKKNPIKNSSEMDDFYDSVKNRMSVHVSKAEVQDMILRLRTRYFNQREENANKKAKKEEGPESAGIKGYKGIALKFEEAMEKDEEMEEEEKKRVSYGRSVEEGIFGEGIELLDDEARSELEKEWKELRKEELALLTKRYELSRRHAEMIYGAMSSKKD